MNRDYWYITGAEENIRGDPAIYNRVKYSFSIYIQPWKKCKRRLYFAWIKHTKQIALNLNSYAIKEKLAFAIYNNISNPTYKRCNVDEKWSVIKIWKGGESQRGKAYRSSSTRRGQTPASITAWILSLVPSDRYESAQHASVRTSSSFEWMRRARAGRAGFVWSNVHKNNLYTINS